MDEKASKIAELRHRVSNVEPLEEEADFHTLDETLMRYLVARDWDLAASEKLLRGTIEYRRKHKPQHMDCSWCHKTPGFHTMRQVGFDKTGRPVMYSCFPQSTADSHTVEDAIAHCLYLVENATRSMPPGVHSWVWILDAAGLPFAACNPKLAYEVANVFSNHYPERLGMCLVVHTNLFFQGVWRAAQVFLPPATVAKMKLLRSDEKMDKVFHELLPTDLADWMVEEVRLNKSSPIAKCQMEFWKKPADASAHDPRGCDSYVLKYVDEYRAHHSTDLSVHKPHPNIVDQVLLDSADEVTL